MPRKREVLLRIQRKTTLRTVSAYRTVFRVPAGVVSSLLSADLLLKSVLLFQSSGHRVIVRRGRTTDPSSNNYRSMTETFRKWDGGTVNKIANRLTRWVGRTHGKMTFGLTQVMSDYGCFNKYQVPTCNSKDCFAYLHRLSRPSRGSRQRFLPVWAVINWTGGIRISPGVRVWSRVHSGPYVKEPAELVPRPGVHWINDEPKTIK